MPQNIYDKEVFFAGYRQLRDNDSGINGAIEIPSLRTTLGIATSPNHRSNNFHDPPTIPGTRRPC
jgi:hypothetical protein